MTGQARRALAELLLDLFGADELRRFVKFNLPPGVARALPTNSSPARLADEVVDQIERGGLVSSLWPALVEARPYRKPDIDAVQQQVEVAPQPPEPDDAVFKQWFDDDDLDDIYDAHAAAKLVTPDNLDLLTQVLDPTYAATLTQAVNPAVRLQSALIAMNRVEKLADGSIPLKQWLRMAARMAAHLPQGAVLKAFRKQVG